MSNTVNIGYHQFLVLVQTMLNNEPDWRYGQALFNALTYVRPDLSEQVRATPIDPFFRDLDNIDPALWAFLMENW